MRYLFIINGRADKEAAKEEVLKQLSELEDSIEYETYVTSEPGDATRYIRLYCTNCPEDEVCFVACGGDGTINEVSSGLVGSKNKHMAILALGTGNDFIKYYKGRDFKSIRKIIDGTPERIDILKINEDRYSINVCNFGFDAIVCTIGNKLGTKGWKNPYRWGVFGSIFIGRFNRIAVVADGERIDHGKMLLCTLSNNSYVGGEFKCGPRAKNNDGLIDLCYVKSCTLAKFLSTMGTYTKGEHLDTPSCMKIMTYRQVRHVEIKSEKSIELCLDGEMLPGDEFTVDIMPGEISLIVPAAE